MRRRTQLKLFIVLHLVLAALFVALMVGNASRGSYYWALFDVALCSFNLAMAWKARSTLREWTEIAKKWPDVAGML